ncbi:hypothetical protein DMUE_5830, partial [Dictyocoela muelleri]
MCWRKLQSIGLSSLYINDEKFRKLIRKILNLAYFPIKTVKIEFEKINEELNQNFGELNSLMIFLAYFERMFIKQNDVGIPIFEVSFWSAYERVLNGLPRTTNSCEGWHKNLNFHCEISHPNIAKFINTLQKIEETVRYRLIQVSEGIDLNITNLNFSYEYYLKTTLTNYEIFE